MIYLSNYDFNLTVDYQNLNNYSNNQSLEPIFHHSLTKNIIFYYKKEIAILALSVNFARIMLKTIFIVLFYLLAPAIVLRLCAKYSFLNKIGAVLVCYVIGFIIGQFEFIKQEVELLDVLSSATVLLALPLLLFQIDINAWNSLACNVFISMCSALIALIFLLLSFFLICFSIFCLFITRLVRCRVFFASCWWWHMV